MKLSIIIPCYNRLDMIRKTINSVVTHTDIAPEVFEILLVDNLSPYEGVAEYLNIIDGVGNVKVLRPGKNLGCHGAMNYGFQIAKGEYLVKLDDDTEVVHKWASTMIRAMEARKDLPYLAADCTAKHFIAYHLTSSDSLPGKKLYFAELGPGEPGIVGFPCVMFRRSTYEEWPKFENDRLYGEEESHYRAEATKRGMKIAKLLNVEVIHNGVYESAFNEWKRQYGLYKPDGTHPTSLSFPEWAKENGIKIE